MIRVKISKDNQVTNQADFSNLEEAQSWLSSQQEVKAFGEPAQWIREDDALRLGYILAAAIETRQVQGVSGEVTEYHFSAEYDVSFEDVTQEFEQQQKESEALEDQRKGARILSKIVARNRDKVGLTGQQILQLQQTYLNVQLLLQNGSLTTAKGLVQATTPDGIVMTNDDKLAVIGFFEQEGV